MLSEESLEDRQTNEFGALKSIYNGDLEDLRNSPWNVWTPLDLKITLTPQQGHSEFKEVYAKLDLHIICPHEYPNKIPKILFENTLGLSKKILAELRTSLEQLAEEHKGEVMIFELAQHVEAFLSKHNKPGPKSFYDEMIDNQKEREKEEQKKKNEIKQVIVTEVAERQQILMQESRLWKEKVSVENSSSDDRRSSTVRSSSGSFIEFEDDTNCYHKGIKLIKFSLCGNRSIQRGKCLNHNSNSVVFSGLDTESGDAVLITEWSVINESIDRNQFQKQISNLEQEMNNLVKLEHINLVPYLNMRHEYIEAEAKFIIYTLQEFIYGCNCMSLFIYNKIPVEINMLQHIASSVLSGLDHLHRHNVVHKELTNSCIYLNNKGAVKLSNYSLFRRLNDLILPKPSSNYGKKQDIYMFGLLLLSLIKGKEVDDSNCEIPINVPPILSDFLRKCLNDKDRLPASELLNHQFLKTPLQRQSPKRKIEEEEVSYRNVSPENPALDLNMLSNSNNSNQSRVQSEFQVLDCLGKGAYGEVFKVKNKLDQGYYAIKRIELNPKNKQLNKKIIREVKLLSKLNHENVVRYYNSWIESTVIEVSETDHSSPSLVLTSIPKVIQRKELTFKDDIELLAPPVQEWSGYDSKSKGTKDVSSSSDDDSSDDDDNDWGLMIKIDESDSIEFIDDGDGTDDKTLPTGSEKSTGKTVDTVDAVAKHHVEKQYMYIQMEFCERSTLRIAIDNGLYRENDRMWRLFREIVEGLAHIHQQGMIHRDLKPVNIFLDSKDHVKIGDFGLATTNIISRTNDPITFDRDSSSQEFDGSMTGHVGTALYVAPELCIGGRVVYNQKVDIYSLGIILFEMCYKPLETAMERIKILNGLRTREIIFPKDFRECANEKKETVIKWLLNHCESERPTSQEVLQSDNIPPPVLEEYELQELVRHTLNNPHLKAYKYLVESCFKQTTSPAQDITYDKDPSIPYSIKNVRVYDYVKQFILEIFKLHGGQNLSTPLLMPNSKYYGNVDSCTKLMTHSGSIVSIPHDLRVPFARYIVWNAISTFRRYAIERVYREKKVFGFLPRELYECAFDIVTPTPGSFMADAELIFMLSEFATKIPELRNKNFLIRLNHTSLIMAILSYCGIKNNHNEVFSMLSSFKEEKVSKFDLRNYLFSLGIIHNAIDTLITLIELEGPIDKIAGPLQMITRKRSETSQMAKTALNELKVIVQNSELFGVELPILIAPGLLYNIHQYSGMMCQLTCEVKKKNNQSTMNVIAAGGRYDGMIVNYRNIMEQADMLLKDVKQSAVGISLSLDKIVQIIQKDNLMEKNTNHLDVVVCAVGSKCSNREKIKVLKDLWELGLKCSCIETHNVDDVHEWWSEFHVRHFILLKESEPGIVRIRTWESGRFNEQKIDTSDLINALTHKLKTRHDSTNSGDQNYGGGGTSVAVPYSRSESKISWNEKCDHPHENNTMNILFVTQHDDKLAAHARRRYESQIRSNLEDFVKKLTGEIMIVAANIDNSVIKKIAAFLDDADSQTLGRSVEMIVEKHQKHKKYLTEICEEIIDLKTKRSLPIVILYSLSDSFYKIV